MGSTKYLAAVATFGMALSLYACGGKDEAKPEKAATKEEGHEKKDGHKKGIVLSPEALRNAAIKI